MEFGERFKKVLEANGISQKKFAEDNGLHPGLTSRYLRGEKPSFDFLLKAIRYFPDVDLNYLFQDIKDDGEGKVSEGEEIYFIQQDPMKIIEDIEFKLNRLKSVLPQK